MSIVFYVALKLSKPDDPIENVIVRDTYGLKWLRVTPGKVRKILEKFGSKCLLILDGLDEQALGQNSDVKENEVKNTYSATSLSHPDPTVQGRWRNILIQLSELMGFQKMVPEILHFVFCKMQPRLNR